MHSAVEDPKLVLDSRNVESATNLKMVLGKATKHLSNPLMVEDKPWEVRTDNMYPNVIYDEEESVFKLWYNPFSSFPEVRECVLCYAISRDGLHWEKPELEVCAFKGIRKTNILSRLVHGVGVAKDLHDADPDRRYKMLYLADPVPLRDLPEEIIDNFEPRRRVPKSPSLCVAFSPDGIHWHYPQSEPVAAWEANTMVGDTHNNFLWDPSLQVYAAVTRLWEKNARVVGRMTSSDFVHWTKPEIIFRAMESETPGRQLYAMPSFLYAGVYIGLLAVFNSDPDEDTVDLELAWSPDGKQWERVCPNQPLIPRGEVGDFDSHVIFGSLGPIAKDGRIWLYYAGCNGKHGGERRSSLGLAHLRMDGFAALEASVSEVGRIETSQVLCKGHELRVNAECGNGWLKARVMDENGKTIPGFDISDCNALKTDEENQAVQWKSGANLSSLGGRKVRVTFEFQNARLYSYSLY